MRSPERIWCRWTSSYMKSAATNDVHRMNSAPVMRNARRVLGSTEEDFCNLVDRRVDGLQLGGRLGDRHGHDILAAQCDHHAVLAAVRRVDGGDAETRCEHAVEGR